MALKIRFLLTSRCTATCAYCHNEGQGTQGTSLLRLSTIQHILDTLAAANIVPDEIILSGGEPTLHKHVGKIAQQCKATGTRVSMDSHAGHPQLLQAALPYLDELKLHVDSFDADQQKRSMGLDLNEVLTSIQLAQAFPALQLHFNHPLQDVQDTAEFVKQARGLGVNCKVIEMFGEKQCSINLRSMNWSNLGYQQQSNSDWLHANGIHRVFHKRCGAEHNNDNTLFIGADGIRRALDGSVISTAEKFHINLLNLGNQRMAA